MWERNLAIYLISVYFGPKSDNQKAKSKFCWETGNILKQTIFRTYLTIQYYSLIQP